MPRPKAPHAIPKVHEDQRQPIHIPTVQEAEAALEAHNQTCPGLPLEVYGDPIRERLRQQWLDQKDDLKSALDMARRFDCAHWKDVPIPEPHKETPMPIKKTNQEKLQTMLTRLDRLISEGKGRQASNLKCHIRTHCELTGLPVPQMPTNPNPTPGIISKNSREAIQAEAPLTRAIAEARAKDRLSVMSRTAPETPTNPSRDFAGPDTLYRQTKRLMVEATKLLETAIQASERDRSEAVDMLGNLDAMVHLVATYTTGGRIEVGSC